MSLAVLLALLVYWSAAAFATVLYLRRQVEADPKQTLTAAESRLVIPVALFAALTISLLLPNLTEWLLGNDPHHPIGADLHLHGVPDGMVYQASLILIAGLVSWACLPPMLSWFRHSVLMRHLMRVSERRRLDQLVSSDRLGLFANREAVIVPGAWIGLIGVLRPTLVVGADLLEELRPEELVAALAHEEAHRRHGHAWRRMVLLAISRMLPVLGGRLHRRWMDACERLCDLEAARIVENPAWVASALLRVHHLQAADRRRVLRFEEEHVALGFASPGALADRVERLLKHRAQSEVAAMTPVAPVVTVGRRAWLLLLAASASIIFLHVPIHQAVERLLGTIR